MDELTEVKALKNLLGSLLGKRKIRTQVGTVAPGQVEKMSRKIIEAILDELKIGHGRVERKKSAEGVVLRYHVSIGSRKLVLKCYSVFESRYFNLTLWSGDSQELLDVMAIGDVRQASRLEAMGKIRLKPWAKGAK